jgi:hypothetical protein
METRCKRANQGKSTVGFAFPKGSGLESPACGLSVRFNGLHSVSPQFIAGRVIARGARSQLSLAMKL